MNGYMTINEAAKYLGIKPEQIRRRCRSGQMPGATKPAGKWVIETGAIEELLEKGKPRILRYSDRGNVRR